MREIDTVILHCSATKPHQDIGVPEIRRWHVASQGWSDIGYHFVIRRDGTVEAGRDLGLAGAHTRGHNARSIGVCLVGGIDTFGKPENNFRPAQWTSLEKLVRELLVRFPGSTVHGHREFAAKDCPCFDVNAWQRKVLV